MNMSENHIFSTLLMCRQPNINISHRGDEEEGEGEKGDGGHQE